MKKEKEGARIIKDIDGFKTLCPAYYKKGSIFVLGVQKFL